MFGLFNETVMFNNKFEFQWLYKHPRQGAFWSGTFKV